MNIKRIIFFNLLLFAGLAIHAQKSGYFTHYVNDPKLAKTAKAWVASGEWRNGFTKASPDPSVNAIDFYVQYHKNPEQWKAMFQWLQNTDLLALPQGRHPIPGTTLVASVEDGENEPLDKRISESHYHHIDVQYVVKGVEGFGLIDHYTSKPNCKYDPSRDVIHYDFIKDRTKVIKSHPGYFNIFFPGDWHIARVLTNEPDQHQRVVVIKIDVR
ncbi:MAG: YhcH/YjgK/YiaL family protein [Prevotella sp.]|jgi:YhcH/YjgK/YiaL family protein|nr:YhcH/YjgK/YiaL family protein [Prevotella sp.]